MVVLNNVDPTTLRQRLKQFYTEREVIEKNGDHIDYDSSVITVLRDRKDPYLLIIHGAEFITDNENGQPFNILQHTNLTYFTNLKIVAFAQKKGDRGQYYNETANKIFGTNSYGLIEEYSVNIITIFTLFSEKFGSKFVNFSFFMNAVITMLFFLYSSTDKRPKIVGIYVSILMLCNLITLLFGNHFYIEIVSSVVILFLYFIWKYQWLYKNKYVVSVILLSLILSSIFVTTTYNLQE